MYMNSSNLKQVVGADQELVARLLELQCHKISLF